jgi:hypothetical protein
MNPEMEIGTDEKALEGGILEALGRMFKGD